MGKFRGHEFNALKTHALLIIEGVALICSNHENKTHELNNYWRTTKISCHKIYPLYGICLMVGLYNSNAAL